MTRLDADFSGVTLSLTGLTARLSADLTTAWAGFLTERLDLPTLAIEVEAEAPSASERPFAPKEMRFELIQDRASFVMDQGVATSGSAGPVTIHLASTTPRLQAAALVNLVTAAIAWRLPWHGGLLLHAAGIVLEGRAFVLIGGEGIGKTTWAKLARTAGAAVLGDDLILVQRRGAAWEALASPLRARESSVRAPSRWPIAALLGARHAGTASLLDDPAIHVEARLLANAPYAIDGFGRHDALDAVLDGLAREVPHRLLAFAREASFLAVLRDAIL